MKITSSKKCIEEIRYMIEIQKKNVTEGMDKYNAFDLVYDYMQLFDRLKLLNKKQLDVLWNEACEITK
jgi:hypothetical protein